jgi:hypothetical protein
MRPKLPVWVACLLLVLMIPTMVLARYGPGWAATELAAFIASGLPAFLIKPATWRQPGRHLSWVFTYFVYLMMTLLFPLVALVVGLWLSPWWCLVISLGAGVLSVAGVWPAQLRYYRLQRQRRQP